jgi:hypothetical protein
LNAILSLDASSMDLVEKCSDTLFLVIKYLNATTLGGGDYQDLLAEKRINL